MGFNGTPDERLARARQWMAARAGKPRVRVRFMFTASLRRGWFAGHASDDGLYLAFVGPLGARSHFHFVEPGESLDQAWRAFCDHHLSTLGYSDAGYRASRCLSPDVPTLAPDAAPVSGKPDQPFPLTAGFP